MLKVLLLLLASLLLIVVPLAHADEEGLLAFKGFHLESDGIGASGPVSVLGIQGKTGIASLVIDAFGKHYVVSPGQIALLKGTSFNGAQISYSLGYKEVGGRTIYLVLSQGFTSGVPVRKLVEVSESGKITVGVR